MQVLLLFCACENVCMLEESVIQVMCVSAVSIARLLSVPNGLLSSKGHSLAIERYNRNGLFIRLCWMCIIDMPPRVLYSLIMLCSYTIKLL